MRIKNANGTVLETENALVVEQWIKAGFVDITEPAGEKSEEKKPEEKPEEKPKRTRRVKQ